MNEPTRISDKYDALAFRRFQIACERERLAPHGITPDEEVQVSRATIGRERINYELVGRVLGVRLQERNTP